MKLSHAQLDDAEKELLVMWRVRVKAERRLGRGATETTNREDHVRWLDERRSFATAIRSIRALRKMLDAMEFHESVVRKQGGRL